MKNNLPTKWTNVLACTIAWLSVAGLHAQTFPTPGFTLSNGKTIYITYEVDVNANACPTGTMPTDLSNQSNVSGSNFGTVQTDDPTNPAANPSPTLTPLAGLALGNLVYRDNNSNGLFDGGDAGVSGVLLRLYLDDGDGTLDAGDGAALATATTAGGGLYSFTPLCPGDYIVEIAASNFNVGGPLYDNVLNAALISSPVGGAADPDNDVNNDDNGDPVAGFGVASAAITLALGTEPINDGDTDPNTNLTLDFGFKNPTTVTINDVTMNEGTGGSTTAFTFTVTRSIPDEAFSLTVNTTDGTATVADNDYAAISGGTVSFTAGGPLTQTVTVLVNHDNKVEPNETFSVVLSGAPAGIIISDGTGVGTITNDDAAVVTLTAAAAQNEGNAGPTFYGFTATLNNPVQGGFTVPYTLNPGTATFVDLDFAGLNSNLTFAGTAGETQTISVQINGDLKVELDETFTVALGSPSAAGVTTAGSPATGTITNDDAATVSLAGNVSQAENLTPQVFTVNLSNPVDVPVTVLFNTSNGTAAAPGDYGAITNQTVTFAANTTTAQVVNVTIVNDALVEANEVYNVSIGTLAASGRNVSLGTSSGTGTITNDDAATVTLSGGGAANEGNTGTTLRVFTATLNNPVQGGFTLPYTTNDGTATTADNDYVDNDGPALVFAGTAAEAKTITVLVNGDTKVEANETFTVVLGAITGAPAGVTTAGSPQTGTINNDELDWGDGPDSLPTLLVYNGARHNTVLGFQLGAAIDGDPDGQLTGGSSNNQANGDDTDADGDDEDGVTLPGVFVTGTTATITVNASQAGKLDAFMDFNWNRQLGDAGEKIFNNLALVAGDNVLTFNVPANAVVGSSFLRFRFSSAGGLSNSGAAADGEVEDYRTNIVNNQLSIDNPSVVEGNAGTTSLVYTVSRTTNTNASSVNYAITGGTATVGSDYVALAAGTLNFPAGGALSQTITVTVNGDVVVENNETVIITLSNATNGGIGSGTGTGTITNDDAATITLSGGSAQNEGNSGQTDYLFTVTLNNAVQGGFTIAYNANNGTATVADNDYLDNDGTLIFAGTAGESQTFIVKSLGDIKVELNETFTVTLGALTGAPAAVTTAGSPQTATITNDDAATVALAGNVSQPEATTPQTFSVTLSNPVDVAVTVQFSTSNGTATTADSDYTGIASQTVTFAAGTTTAQSVPVTIINDTKVEANEVYNVSLAGLSAGGRNVALGTSAGTGTITNDDAATIAFTGGTTQSEGQTGTTPYTFTATLSNAVQGGFTLTYTTSDGTATTANSDYQDNDGTLTFAGTAGETQTITVLVNGDYFVEPNETFTVALGTISGAPAGVSVVGAPQTNFIINDEFDFSDAPTAAQSGFAGSYVVGSKFAQFGYSLGSAIDGDPAAQPTSTADGDDTDAEGDDDDGVTLPGVLVTGTTASITVNANLTSSPTGGLYGWVDFNQDGDWSDAGEQVFTNIALANGNNNLSFAVPAGATPGISFARFILTSGALSGPGDQTNLGEVEDYQVNLVNNQFSIDNPSVAEGNAGTTNLTYTVSRTTNANASSVDYAITGGTATAGSDYAPLAAGTLNFTAGGALSQTITVTINGDLIVENNETVIITLSNPVSGGISNGTGTGTITNDDSATLTLSGGTAKAETNGGTVAYTFTATLNAAVQGGFQVAYTTNNGTATAGSDYIDNDGSLTFAGTAGESKTITVLVNGDILVELDETFTVALGAISGTTPTQLAAISTAGSPQTGTITNDDAAVVSIAANVSQVETTTPQNFSVTLSNPVDVAVTVQFTTANGTATTADNDYTGIAGQTLTFAAGTTTAQTVPVTIISDTKVEADEVYNVSIGTLNSGGRNVSLGTSSGTGTILNDDAAIVTLSGGIAQNEGNSGTTAYVFTATLNNAVQGGVVATYATNDGTATTADNDYTDNDGTLIFAGTAGETKTFTVLVNGDNKVEANETFQTALTNLAVTGGVNPVNVSTSGSPQTATILNDEVDYGDAPDTYGTLLASNGARHATVLGFRLGAGIDGENDGQPSANATGDGADEDGVTLPNPLVTSTTANVTVNASSAGRLDGWVDFNNNGSWADAGENVFNNVAVAAGNNSLSFLVPNGATPSNTFARFRLSSAGGLAFNGAAADGEVEDYAVQIVNTQFTINDPVVVEGNAGTSNLIFTITRSNNASNASVNYAITGGTATAADNDYQPLAAGTLNFTAGGALTQTITVLVNGDVKVELDETVDITLSGPVNGSILDGSGTGTITNDDAATVTITNPSVTEGDVPNTTTLTFTVNLSNPSDANVGVNYATLDGTATTANNDYTATSGTLTFTPGQLSKTVAVTIIGDCAIEPNETLLLRLSALVNNGRNISLSGGGATLDGTGTINNDDAIPVMTCPANLTVNASNGVCNATVTLPLPTTSSICGASTLEFHYRTVDAANNPTGNYTAFAPAASNSVNFAVGRYEVEWRITDGSGTVSCSHFLTVVDNQAPTTLCQNITVNLDASGMVTITPAQVNNGSFDNCGIVSLVLNKTVFNCSNIGNNTVILTATDAAGNVGSCTAVVMVKDVIAPIALCKNIIVNLNSLGTVTVLPSMVNNGSSDICGFTLSLTPSTFTCANIGNNTVTLKVTDPGGNMATCSAVVTVKDQGAPTAKCKNINVFLDDNGHASITPAAVNNGSFDNCGLVTLSINVSEFDCGQIGGTPVTVMLKVIDQYNNQSSCLAYVTVKDAIKPTAICENVTVQLNAQGKVTVYPSSLALNSIDNCSVWAYSPTAKVYTCANLGNNLLTITVKDFSNNFDVCVSTVTVVPAPGGCNTNLNAPGAPGGALLTEDALALRVYPNPTVGRVQLAFGLPAEQPYTLRLFDLTGRLLLHRADTGSAGENILSLDLGDWAAGLYILEVQTDGLKEQQRLVIQRD